MCAAKCAHCMAPGCQRGQYPRDVQGGYPQGGYQYVTPPGTPIQGYPPQDFTPQGYGPQGYPQQGYGPQGYPPMGFQQYPPGYPPGNQLGSIANSACCAAFMACITCLMCSCCQALMGVPMDNEDMGNYGNGTQQAVMPPTQDD